MKSNFLVLGWLIFLQIGFVSYSKGQYEDQLCQEWLLDRYALFSNNNTCHNPGIDGESYPQIRMGSYQGIDYFVFRNYWSTPPLYAFFPVSEFYTLNGNYLGNGIIDGQGNGFEGDRPENEQTLYICTESYPNCEPKSNIASDKYNILCTKWVNDTIQFYINDKISEKAQQFNAGKVGSTIYYQLSFLAHSYFYNNGGDRIGYTVRDWGGNITAANPEYLKDWKLIYENENALWNIDNGPIACIPETLGNSISRPIEFCDKLTLVSEELNTITNFNNCGGNISKPFPSKFLRWKTLKGGNFKFILYPNKEDDDLDFVVYKNGISDNNVIRCMAAGDGSEKWPNSNCLGPTGLDDFSTNEVLPAGCEGVNYNYLKSIDTGAGDIYYLAVFNTSKDGSKKGFKLELSHDQDEPFFVQSDATPNHKDVSLVRFPYFGNKKFPQNSLIIENYCDSLIEFHGFAIDTIQLKITNDSECGKTKLYLNNNNVKYLWSTGETGDAIIVTPMINTIYSVTITDYVGDTVILTKSVAPNTLRINQDSIIITPSTCGEDNGKIVMPDGNYIYKWEDNSNSRVREFLKPGIYDVTVSDNSSLCIKVFNDIEVKNSNFLNATFEITQQPTCGQSNGKVEILNNSNNYNYEWSIDTIVGGAPENVKAGDYIVTVTKKNTSCLDTITISVNDYNLSIDLSVSNEKIDCFRPEPVIINVIPTITTYQIVNYAWMDQNLSGNSVQIEPIQTTTYKVTVTDQVGCTATAVREIIVDKQQPKAEIQTLDGNTITCRNTILNLEASSDASNTSYRWINGFSGNQKNVQVSKPDTYALEVTNTNNGCKDTVIINIGIDTIAPVFAIKYDTVLTCKALSSKIKVENTSGNEYSYRWSNGNTTDNNIEVEESGDYFVTVTNTQNYCNNTSIVTIIQDKDIPNVENFEAVITCKNPDTLVSIYKDLSPIVKLTYSDGSDYVDSVLYNDATSFTVIHEYVHNGCKDSMYVKIIIDTTQIAGAVCGDGMFIQSDCECRLGCSQLKIKDDHLINPNLSGIGGYLSLPITSVFDQNKLTIMNRWGQKVYEKSPYISTDDEGWRGTFMDTGEPLPDGAYYYQLILTPEDKSCRFAGSVTVVR